MVIIVNNIQGNARVINYTGIVRGATQRLVKLEISKHPNDELIYYLDKILLDLQNGGGQYNLIKLQDEEYLKNLSKLSGMWENLKEEISRTRLYGVDNTNILELSEIYFDIANNTVNAAEIYADGKANELKQLEVVLNTIIFCIIILLIKQTISAIALSYKNSELNKMAYIDLNTGLTNKGRCDQLFSEYGILSNDRQFACIIFDLNNLKMVNDTFGHSAGDTLILNFANILRNSATDNVFIGRYGGDEFIAVLHDTNEDEVKSIIGNVKANTQNFNKDETRTPISYAFGYELSGHYTDCTLQFLIDEADKNMYINKFMTKKTYENKKGDVPKLF